MMASDRLVRPMAVGGIAFGALAGMGCGQVIGLGELSRGTEPSAADAGHQPLPDGGGAPDAPLQAEDGYVRIEPGTFVMGSPPDELGRLPGETQHTVTLTRAYWLQARELTQGEWEAVTGSNPSYFKACGPACPVEMVNWYEVVAFCNKLSQAKSLPPCYWNGSDPYDFDDAAAPVRPSWPEGIACRGYRLPTEAEWELAARAGSAHAFSSGDANGTDCDDPAVDRVGWYCGDNAVTYAGCEDSTEFGGASCAGTHPGGLKEPNAWGLYDVHGNVWEWVWDWYESYEGDTWDPLGPSDGQFRAGRGGFWYGATKYCRVARRFTGTPDGRTNYLGVRLARTAE